MRYRVRYVVAVLFCFTTILTAQAKSSDAAKSIIGRWTPDIRASLATFHENPEYKKGDPDTKAQLDAALASDLAQVLLEITADTIKGMDATSKYRVSSVSGNRVTITTEDEKGPSETTFEVIDANTIRILPPPDVPMTIVLRRDTTTKPPAAVMHPPDAAKQDEWLKHIAGKWRIDRVTPMMEAQRASQAYKRATPQQRKQSEEFWKSLSEGPAEYFEFTRDSIRSASDGHLPEPSTPLRYKLVSLAGSVAVIEVTFDDGKTYNWTLTERADGSIRQSAGGADNFDLYRVTK